ncbi:MAG TPA: hypothetical protein VIK86_05560 [Candidatus Paceibacterota bacterium]
MEKTFIIHFKNGMTKEISEQELNKILTITNKTTTDLLCVFKPNGNDLIIINLSEIVYIDEKVERQPTNNDVLNAINKQLKENGFATSDGIDEDPLIKFNKNINEILNKCIDKIEIEKAFNLLIKKGYRIIS